MLSLAIKDLSPLEIQSYLNYAIAPRPICLASTVNRHGYVNLSPFSFFNFFSTNPPICIFSPARRIRDNTSKHTLENVIDVPECAINIVNYDMVQQMSLSSTEYLKNINEFEKAGFTMLESLSILPPRVAEAPVQLECKVNKIIPLGYKNGAGNLVLAEIKHIHIKEEILDAKGNIDQEKIDLVSRLGGDWYARITPDNLFKVRKPVNQIGIGIDKLPKHIQFSKILSGNDLGQLGNLEELPEEKEIELAKMHPLLIDLLNKTNGENRPENVEKLAKKLIEDGQLNTALAILMIDFNY